MSRFRLLLAAAAIAVAPGPAAFGSTPAGDGAESKATIKIECDLDCLVTVGLEAPRSLAAGEELSLEVAPGAVKVQIAVDGVAEARVVEELTLAAGDRERLRPRMAKALAELRKIEARDRTYRDADTRLMWPTRDNGADLDWQGAVEYCDALEHGAWTDWRLPTLDELEGIEAMWSLRPFKTADPITLSACCSWSSDRIDEERAWNFNYRFRRPFRGHLGYSLNLRALCVRDGRDEIPENTRRNRRLARREEKEKLRERRRRQAERAAEEAAAQEEQEQGDDDPPPAKDDGGL